MDCTAPKPPQLQFAVSEEILSDLAAYEVHLGYLYLKGNLKQCLNINLYMVRFWCKTKNT